jgi:hypothetical protein
MGRMWLERLIQLVIALLFLVDRSSTFESHSDPIQYIVMYGLIARQWLGKHIPAEVYACNNRTSLLGNGSVNKPSQQ